MLIRPKPLPIDPQAPFALDRLGRKESATTLTQLLNRVDTPFVLALDAKWGNGKTTFVQMWKHHLANENIRCLYFNAWESDFSSDPLLAFIGALNGQLEDQDSSALPQPLIDKFAQVKDAGISLAKRIIPVAVKLGTAGVLDLDSFSEGAIAGLAADLAKAKIENYESDKKTVKKFKTQLEEYIKDLSGHTVEGKHPPVVFFVDELDRCRPTYTVELLERIKHFFDVEGLAFVLSIDKEQLGHSIRAVYGAGIDVDGYLRRFIDLEYTLPEMADDNFVMTLANRYQIQTILQKLSVPSRGTDDKIPFELFNKLARIFGLTLRQQEQVFGRLSVALLTWPIGTIRPDLLFLVILLLLKTQNEELYRGLQSSGRTFQDLLNFIQSMPGTQDFLSHNTGVEFELYCLAWRQAAKDPTVTTQLDEYKKMTTSDGLMGKLPQDTLRRAKIMLGDIDEVARGIAPLRFYYQAIEISGQFREPPENSTPADAPRQ